MKLDLSFSEIKNDLPASIVVFFVALPLCLGIALASGAPLFSGIIAGGVLPASPARSSFRLTASLAIVVALSAASDPGPS